MTPMIEGNLEGGWAVKWEGGRVAETGGGGTQVLNGYTHYQMATQSRSSERQNLGELSFFQGKHRKVCVWGEGGGSTSNWESNKGNNL